MLKFQTMTAASGTSTMSAAVVGGIVAVLLNLFLTSALCPQGYQSASPDKCFRAFDIKTSYCQAQDICSRHRGRLVEGSEWLRILMNASSAPWQVSGFNYIWIGLTDFLEERNRDKSGWQWTTGERASAAGAFASQITWQIVKIAPCF